MENQRDKGEVTKEFPQGKENYCPRCYFEDDEVILRINCKHNINQDKNAKVALPN